MSAIYDSKFNTLDKTTPIVEVDLLQGEDYLIGMAGTFDSAEVTLDFIDGANNAIPVPEAGYNSGVDHPITATGSVVVEIPALTSKLRMTATEKRTGTAITAIDANAPSWTGTAESHDFQIGDLITIAGNSENGYNGTGWEVASVSGDDFTVEAIGVGEGTGGTATRDVTPVNISGIVSDADSFTVTAAGHGLTGGETITIAGCTVTAYNGNWTVASVDGEGFDVASALNPGVATDGTVVEVPESFAITSIAPTPASFTLTAAGHGLSPTDAFKIFGCSGVAYNGEWTADAVNGNDVTVLSDVDAEAQTDGEILAPWTLDVDATVTRKFAIER